MILYLTPALLLSQSNSPVTPNSDTPAVFLANATHSRPASSYRGLQRLQGRIPWIRPEWAALMAPGEIRNENLLSPMRQELGDPVFLTASTLSSGGRYASAIAVGDVNGDGIPDLAVANECGTGTSACTPPGVVEVFIGKGDGTFNSPASYGSGGGGPSSAVIADVNGDGHPDLVVTNDCANTSFCTDGGVSVLLGIGDGTFKAASTYDSGGAGASSVAIGDLNGDGKADLAVANNCNSPLDCTAGSVSILFGNGDGTFSLSGVYGSGGAGATSIVVGDLTGLGKQDLVVATRCSSIGCTTGPGTVSVLLNKGNGTFDPAASYSTSQQNAQSTAVAVADVNSDGRLDLIAGNACSNENCTTGTVTVFLGNGNGTFQAGVSYSSGGMNPLEVNVADIDGDGKPDLEIVNQCDYDPDCLNGTVSVLAGEGNGAFHAAITYDSPALYADSIAVADVNRDGRPDLLVANMCYDNGCAAGAVTLLLGRDDGTFRAAFNYGPGGPDANAIAAADLKRDGKLDLVVVSLCPIGPDCPNGGGMGVLMGDGHGRFSKAVAYGSGGSDPDSVAVADVNGDGKPDVVVANSGAPSSLTGGSVLGGIGVLLGNGDGTFRPAMSSLSGGINPDSVKIADVNGDGIPDLVVANECSNSECTGGGVVSVLLGKGDGTFQPAVNYGSGGQYASSVAVADVNRDRKLDLIVSNWCVSSSDCTSGTISVLLGNGDGTFQSAVTYPSGGQFASPVKIVDLNRDGKLDLVVANMNSVGVLLGNGNGTFQTATVTTTPTEVDSGDGSLAIGDFNGDGELDVASGAAGVLLLGKGDGTFQPPEPLGAAGKGLAAGDFSHNGNLDLADTGVTVLRHTSSDFGRRR
jgi:FG-GAP-like repeat/FG-GAP repeat